MQVAEYLLMGTIITLGVLVGLVSYRDALVLEYGDLSAAFESISQSYTFTLTGPGGSTSTYTDGATNLSNTISVSAPTASGESSN